MRLPFSKTPTPQSQSLSTYTDVEKNGGKEDQRAVDNFVVVTPKLLKFQTLTGICSPNVLRSAPTLARPAPNQGIYKRTVDEETKVKLQYAVSNYVVNVGGMLHIVVGAALTALGAANGPSAIVTILGALNTVIAGLLTYLKGQGLPMRLEQYLHLLRTLREHIEEREREFLEPDCSLDVDDEIKRIAKMYQEVRQTAQDNAPGTVLPPRGVITSLLKKPDINRSDVPAPRGDKTPGSMLETGLQDLASFGHHSASELERDGKAAAMEGVGSSSKSVGVEISHLGSMAQDTINRLSGQDSIAKHESPDQGSK